MSGDEQLRIILEQLARVIAVPAPPSIDPDLPVPGESGIDRLLALLGLAANDGDPADLAEAQSGHEQRADTTNAALSAFTDQEATAATRLAGVGQPDQMTQLLTQMPQLASGIAGGIAGLLSGVLQPLGQIPQQLAQAGQQAMQMGVSALGNARTDIGNADDSDSEGDLTADDLPEQDFSSGGLNPNSADVTATPPAAALTPLPIPSAGTTPSSSPTVLPLSTSLADSTAASRGALGGMPMMPPGVMPSTGAVGATGASESKRVVAPGVKNGAAVQGRISALPEIPEVVKRIDSRLVETKRIVVPTHPGTDHR